MTAINGNNGSFRRAARKGALMMRFLSHLDKRVIRKGRIGSKVAPVVYESALTIESKVMPGVSFVINRISFGRRMELSRRIREITQRKDFLDAGSELDEKIEAGILAQEVDVMYLRWALVGVNGLEIDGEPATIDQVLNRGPEGLAREIVIAIKDQCGLSEAERKN
jgi:hypothetical protein